MQDLLSSGLVGHAGVAGHALRVMVFSGVHSLWVELYISAGLWILRWRWKESSNTRSLCCCGSGEYIIYKGSSVAK